MQQSEQIAIAVPGGSLEARVVVPAKPTPGVLLVHGWDSDQDHYQLRAEDFAELGCVCLTFDMRGHGQDSSQSETVSRGDNLQDVLAAYDRLAAHPDVDPRSITLIGTSYGGYLAAIASSLRPVRWLALRVPALYPDADWDVPKARLDREEVMNFRKRIQPPKGNRALSACQAFKGDALVVGSVEDRTVPEQTIRSYVLAFQQAKSITHRSIAGADHGLSDERSRRAYDKLLSRWMNERLLEARSYIGD
ncbi:MAG: alpha/beta fold hydrolase [Variovorax sp.]|nr:MAG: alpha/beta fold hydrolase [Variovorax sp.]